MQSKRRLYVSMLVSLDGYIDGPAHEQDWFRDGDPQFEQYCDEMIDSVGMALYGRRAYELMLSYWPAAEHEGSEESRRFARKMNALPKLVLSSTLERAEWSNTQILRSNVAEAVTKLKQSEGKPIVAWAGAGLVRTLAEHDLVDEYRLIVHPVLLGGGTRLFGEAATRKQLRLVGTAQLGAQLTVLRYEPVRS